MEGPEMAGSGPDIDFDNPYRGRAVFEVGAGWQQILRGLDQKLRATAPGFAYAQVKEKYGGLRVYLDFPEAMPRDARDHALIIEAMREADQTCENCGAAGRLREQRDWVKTLCDGCDEQADEGPKKWAVEASDQGRAAART